MRKDGTTQPKKKETACGYLVFLTAMLLPRKQLAAHTCVDIKMEYLHLNPPTSI